MYYIQIFILHISNMYTVQKMIHSSNPTVVWENTNLDINEKSTVIYDLKRNIARNESRLSWVCKHFAKCEARASVEWWKPSKNPWFFFICHVMTRPARKRSPRLPTAPQYMHCRHHCSHHEPWVDPPSGISTKTRGEEMKTMWWNAKVSDCWNIFANMDQQFQEKDVL